MDIQQIEYLRSMWQMVRRHNRPVERKEETGLPHYFEINYRYLKRTARPKLIRISTSTRKAPEKAQKRPQPFRLAFIARVLREYRDRPTRSTVELLIAAGNSNYQIADALGVYATTAALIRQDLGQ